MSIDLTDPPFSCIEDLVGFISEIEHNRQEDRDHYYEAKEIWDYVLSYAEVVVDREPVFDNHSNTSDLAAVQTS